VLEHLAGPSASSLGGLRPAGCTGPYSDARTPEVQAVPAGSRCWPAPDAPTPPAHRWYVTGVGSSVAGEAWSVHVGAGVREGKSLGRDVDGARVNCSGHCRTAWAWGGAEGRVQQDEASDAVAAGAARLSLDGSGRGDRGLRGSASGRRGATARGALRDESRQRVPSKRAARRRGTARAQPRPARTPGDLQRDADRPRLGSG
jgi:hypothetical protein